MGGIGSGGARKGARRKALDGAQVKTSAKLQVWLIDLIKAEAQRRELSTSQMITELLTKGV